MPSIVTTAAGAMSTLSWGSAAKRIAGSIAAAGQPDAVAAAKDAISETLQDWDSRRDWKFTQVVAPDISITAGDSTFTLPTLFKKPYVAYLVGSKQPLFYIERANYHRNFPGNTDTSIPKWYTLYNNESTGTGDLFPTSSVDDTLVAMYYRSMTYADSDVNATLDILQRWEGYILAGARARLILMKAASPKADRWMELYEQGILLARQDDLRVPDQFLSFMPPDAMLPPNVYNPNSTWQSTMGIL